MYQLQVRVVSGNNLPVGDLNGNFNETPHGLLFFFFFFFFFQRENHSYLFFQEELFLSFVSSLLCLRLLGSLRKAVLVTNLSSKIEVGNNINAKIN